MNKLQIQYTKLMYANKYVEADEVIQKSVKLNKKISQLFDVEKGE